MKKIALITGTSSGIGLHSAVQLAQAGYTVVATLRNPAKADALKQEAAAQKVELDIRQLDVQDNASVAACVQGVLATYGRIDLLVNNAGSGFLGTLEETSMADLQQVMDVNFYGVWRVTQAVFAHMRQSGAGRIISVTSVGGLLGAPFNDAYCAAKFAVEGMMESLAPVAKRLGVEIVLVEPGPVNTEFVASVRSKAAATQNALDAYAGLRNAYLASTTQAFASIGQTGADIGKVVVDAATRATPPFRIPTSEVIAGLIQRKYVDSSGDSVLALTGSRLN